MDFIESCRRLIAIDSSPQAGSLDVINEAANICESLGLKTEVTTYTYEGLEQANLVARIGDGAGEDFLLQNHLDTSDPGPYSLWENTGHNPFNGTVADGKLFGLGAADSKADFICKLHGLKDVGLQSQWKIQPVILATSGEQLGLVGIQKLLRKNKLNAKMALVGAPTNLNVIYAAKGYVGVEIQIPFSGAELEYKRAHDLMESSSTQSKIFRARVGKMGSENAIEKMFSYFEQLPDGMALMDVEGGTGPNTLPSVAMVEFDVVPNLGQTLISKLKMLSKAFERLRGSFARHMDERFDPPSPTLNIGFIKSNEGYVEISGNCRIPPGVSNEAYDLWITELGAACDDVGAKLQVVRYIRPFATSPTSELVSQCLKLARDLDIDAQLMTHSSTNESSVLSRKGIESVSFGPGRKENSIHTAEEFVLLRDLELARDFYASCIRKFCL